MEQSPATGGWQEGNWTPDRLAVTARGLRHDSLELLLIWAERNFQPLCLATSFGPQSIVLMHQIAKLGSKATVFYLDTSLLFPETYALRDRLAERLGMEFVRVATTLSVDEQERRFGEKLWARDPDRCCHLRKVLPLRRFLSDKQAWITGVRNGHGASRSRTGLVEWDDANGLVKLNPLAHWTRRETWDYLRDHRLPHNPLHDDGYPSIGCRPCTRRVEPGADARSGRWAGFEKTECGIHGADLIRIEEPREEG